MWTRNDDESGTADQRYGRAIRHDRITSRWRQPGGFEWWASLALVRRSSVPYCVLHAELHFCLRGDLHYVVDGIASWTRSAQKTWQMKDTRHGQRGVLRRSISGRKIAAASAWIRLGLSWSVYRWEIVHSNATSISVIVRRKCARPFTGWLAVWLVRRSDVLTKACTVVPVAQCRHELDQLGDSVGSMLLL